MAPPRGYVGSVPAGQPLHSSVCFLGPFLSTHRDTAEWGLSFSHQTVGKKPPDTKQLIFASLSLSLHLVLIRSEFTVTIERSQCDSTDRDLHRQYQKYHKAMLIKILLSSAEVIHLCFWKLSLLNTFHRGQGRRKGDTKRKGIIV